MPWVLSLELSVPGIGDLFLVDQRVGTPRPSFRSSWCREKGVVRMGTALDLHPGQVAL